MFLKWMSHKMLTFTLVLVVTDNPIHAACTLPGAVFPDWIEGKPPAGSGYWQWRSRHRGLSHWFVPYAVCMAAAYAARHEGVVFFDLPYLYEAFIYMLLGALLHIAEDAICGKVPVFSPQRRYGIRLFTVGSIMEYLFVIIAVAAMLWYKYYYLGSFIRL